MPLRSRVCPCLLLHLADDQIETIGAALSDPLHPSVAVALSSTCCSLRAALRLILATLKAQHLAVGMLLLKLKGVNQTAPFNIIEPNCVPKFLCDEVFSLRTERKLHCSHIGLSVADMGNLGMLLRTNGLPTLKSLELLGAFGDEGMRMMCEGLGRHSLPNLRSLSLVSCAIGPVGASSLGLVLGQGALPKLKQLCIGHGNAIGDQGMLALAAPLRARVAFKTLYLEGNDISDAGVTSLVANLGNGELKALKRLKLASNRIGKIGCAAIIDAIDCGALPSLKRLDVFGTSAETLTNAPLSYDLAAALGRLQRSQSLKRLQRLQRINKELLNALADEVRKASGIESRLIEGQAESLLDQLQALQADEASLSEM